MKAKKKKSKFGLFFEKLFSKHFAIERFGVSFGIMAGLIAILFVISTKDFFNHQNQQLGSQAMYTTEIKTSKTGADGKVVQIYTNKAKTKSFVLFKFSDPQSVPLNPKQYKFYLAGSSVTKQYQPLGARPAGSFYIFGSTGYMGVYLVNHKGFNSQIYNLIGRINKRIVNDTDVSASNATGTFKKYDQFQIYFNPGATKVKNLKCLDTKAEPSVSDLYSEMILQKESKRIKGQLGDKLDTLAIDLNNIQDQIHRLESYDKIAVPDGPEYIKGDKIVTRNGKKYLETNHIIPGGYNFEWQNADFQNNDILPDLLKQNKLSPKTSIDDFLEIMAEKNKNNTSGDLANSKYTNAVIPDKGWKFKNGKPALVTDGSTTNDSDGDLISKQTTINNDIQNLEQAWQKYISDKTDYQTNQLSKWLNLESNYSNINNFSAVNDSKNVLTLY